jgi:GH35 family endo-1,4-beta-xylanase
VPTYILKAFQIANEHAPNIKQIINQHGGMEDVMWDKVKQTVLYLREKGVRIDGIGWQAHIDVGFEKVDGNMQRLSDLIDWAHANKLEFHVTENTVWLKNDKAGKWDEQADTFGAIVEMVLSKKESGVVSWNIWNLLDTENSNPQWTGSLFFENYQPKPAFATVKEKLIEAIPVQ